jgi:hypothetical protein
MKISRKYKKKRISYKFKQINRKKKTRIKRKYKNKKRTNKKLGGSGVLINEGNMASSRKFLFFMENSTLTFITYGSNGLTVLATLNPQKISPYSSMDPSTYGNPINKIIIKFIVISVIPTIIPLNNGKLNSTLLNQVCDELNIQTDVTLKTMNYLEPISPSPLYFNGKIDYTYLIHTIKPRIVDDGSIGQQILKKTIDDMIQFIDTTEPKNRSRAISIIGMEYAENYNILFRFLNDPNYEQYFYMSAYLIIKLAVDTGYAHGDYHQSNIMINTTKTNYFDGIVGAPLLLDYGYSSKIPIIILNGIKKLFLNKNYTKILEIISSIQEKTD